ncbi:RNA-binding protein 34-like [Toxorhynchites rutilus septentrionalis]|uniref:RNA-binding protein 34-like n=1 Tax=Toxorhynchites rutilus septentrionalis TaxID=329112 RepID=UPI002478CB69|nr:RNA-binding protein 34-like [Toxorhynchites rutilus septentrionalis]
MGKKDKKLNKVSPQNNGVGVVKSFKRSKINVPEESMKLREVVQNFPNIVKQAKKDKAKDVFPEENNVEGQIPEIVEGVSAKKNKGSKKKRKQAVDISPELIEQPKIDKKQKKAKGASTKGHEKPKVIEADIGIDTSESEDEQESIDDATGNASSKSILSQPELDLEDGSPTNSKDEKDAEVKPKKRFPGPEHSIFIGNLPTTVKKSTMKTLFKQFGTILTIRFRSNDGVTLFKKKDKKESKALNCYVRFETREEAEAACCMNGELVEDNRIRVSLHSQKQVGHITSTVFVGNIHRKTTDNELYDFFSRVGDIEYVRQIADRCIGYVCFKKGVSIAKALKMNQQLLNGRPLRIMKVDPSLQSKRRNKKGNLVSKQKVLTSTTKNPPKANTDNKRKILQQEFHGTVAKNKNRKNTQKKKSSFEKKKKILAKKLIGAVRSNE